MADKEITRPEITHPDWCQRDRCTTNPDGSTTHGHLFGTITNSADVEIDVTVERTDTADGPKVKAGPARAYSRINRAGVMSAGDLDRVSRLVDKAAAFAGQRMGRHY